MPRRILKELEYLIDKTWVYADGEEDISNNRADCSGFVHLCLVYLGYRVPRVSSHFWYVHSHSDKCFPSVVSVPGHVGLLISEDLVLEVTQQSKGKNALRSVSHADWILSTKVLGKPKYFRLKFARDIIAELR